MVNLSEWVVIAATLALGAACWRRGVHWIAFLLFLSSVIYFLPSVILLFDGSSLEDVIALREVGISTINKMVAILTAVISIILLGRRVPLKVSIRPMYALLSMALLIGMLTLNTIMEQQRVINTLSLIGMLLLVNAGANALEQGLNIQRTPAGGGLFFLAYLWLLLLFSISVAFYEIFCGLAWASFYSVDNLMVVRASSLYFNPNLFGLFCAMMTVLFAFRWHMSLPSQSDSMLVSGIFIAGLGIFLASSRSLGYLLLIFLLTAGLLMPPGTRGRFKPAMIYVLSLLIAATLSLLWWRIDSSGPAEHFWVLAMRLLDSPVQILAMCLSLLGIPLSGDLGELFLKPETIVAVEGRFMGGERDSGLLTTYDDSGWLGMAAILFFWLYALSVGLRAYAHRRSTEAAYALATVGFCFAVGALMRYQVYPVWIWVALMLAPCFAFWRIQMRYSKSPNRAQQ